MTSNSALTVVDQSPDAVVEWNLDNWPVERFNRLVPTQTLGLATDLIRPVVQVVQLDLERDTYSSNDLPNGHRAPNARGLALLAAAAGVDFPDEVRTDDGSDPRRAAAKVWATMVDGVGRTRTVTGSRDYVLDSLPMTDAQRKRAQGHIYEHALTRARHRALRVLLGLAQSYPTAELQKPFAVVSYVPNLQHPELRELYKQALLPTVSAMYGPGAAKQIGSGDEVIDLDAAEGQSPRLITPAPTTPTTLPGEKLAAAGQDAGDEPAWMREAQSTTDAPAPDLATRIRDTAAAGGMKGAAKEPQLESLRTIFGKIGGRATSAGLRTLWPDLDASLNLTANQAQAVVNIARQHESDEEFAEAWRAMAGVEQA